MVQGVELVEADLASIVQSGPFTLVERLRVRFGLVRTPVRCTTSWPRCVSRARGEDKTTSADWGDGLVKWLGYAAEVLWAVIGPKVRAGDDEARRLWVLAYLGMVSIRGILADDLLKFGYDHVNGETFHALARPARRVRG